MHTATLLFYAIASLFLGLIASSLGGGGTLAVIAGSAITNQNGLALPADAERWSNVLRMATVAVPLVFVGLAVLSVIERWRGREL